MSKKPRYVTRVALAFGRTVLFERMFRRGRITLGEAPGCTLILPGTARGRKGKHVLLGRKGVHLFDGLEGRLHLSGEVTTLEELRDAGRKAVKLGAEDWGVLRLKDHPAVRIVVSRVQAESLGPMPRDRSSRPWILSTLVSGLTFGLLLMIAYLRYDPDRSDLEVPEISERMAKVMFSPPPEPPPEQEPEISDKTEEEEKARKKAGGDEGKFGRSDRTGPSNIPRNPDEVASNVGLVKELNDLSQSNAIGDLLGVSGQVSSAMGGLDDGALVVGEGAGGMSTKGGGGGGGGEGEGSIHGTGELDVGGAGSQNRKRTVKGQKKPAEKAVSVKTGNATVKGQLSKELIDREVRRHRAQVTFCYNKQLLRHPDLQGKVVLRWVIAMDGSVRAAKVKSSSLGNQDAESCMVRALESWKFPKPEGGVVQVDYPFLFGTK